MRNNTESLSYVADLCDPGSVLWSVDLPHIRQHNQTSDEDNDAENRAGGQHKGLFQGHEPSSQMSPNSHC